MVCAESFGVVSESKFIVKLLLCKLAIWLKDLVIMGVPNSSP